MSQFRIGSKIQVSQETYLKLKREILSGEIFTRIDIKVVELKIKNTKTLLINDGSPQGREVNITRQALGQLCTLLGMNKSFYDLISSTVDADTELVNLIISSIKKGKVDKITILFNNVLGSITSIYGVGEKLISDNQYFDTLEKVLEKTPNSYLRNITYMPNGNISAVLANPDLEFSLGNIKDETFSGGMTLDLINNTMQTSFFTERLICSNGNTICDKTSTKHIRVNSEVPSFIEAILSPSYQYSSVEDFKKKVNRIYNTPASLKEVLKADQRIHSILGNDVQALILMENLSSNILKKQFPESYLKNTEIHKYLRTNVTVWELVNEITAISSRIEQNRLNVGDRTNRALQILGGDFILQPCDLPPNSIKQLF